MTDKPASKDPILRALHEARRAQGLTLLDVAERMGRMTPQSPCHWENGKRSPSLVNLHEWAGALGYELTLTKSGTRSDLEEIDRNARAYGFEIGRGVPLAKRIEYAEGNPFIDPDWRDRIGGAS